MFAFGVSTQALLYHNQKLDSNLLKSVFFPAFFFIGGEYYTKWYFLDSKLKSIEFSSSFLFLLQIKLIY